MNAMFTNPEAPRPPKKLEEDDDHPIYDLSFDDTLWHQRIVYENAYAHAFQRRFGVPPSIKEAFNMSYQIQVTRQMISSRFQGLSGELDEKLDDMREKLEKFIDTDPEA